MTFTALVDVAIGLALVYMGASLLVTVLNEWVAQLLRLRGKQLAVALHGLLELDELMAVKRSPVLRGIVDGGKKGAASYIDAKILAQNLVGTLSESALSGDQRQTGAAVSMGQLRAAIGKLPDSTIRRVLAVLAQSTDKLDDFVDAVADWSDRSLCSLGEGYKKRLQWIGLALGLLVAVGGNIQTLHIVGRLYTDKELRDEVGALSGEVMRASDRELVAQCPAVIAAQKLAAVGAPAAMPAGAPAATPVGSSAGIPAESGSGSIDPERCVPLRRLVDGVSMREATLGVLPVGWRADADLRAALMDPINWLGWLLTAFALSLGAPFWFDLLNRMVNIRHGMRKPETPPAPRPSAARD